MTRKGRMRESKFDLYTRSREKFSTSLFRDPTSEYRGCPLWAWNSELHKPLLRKEIRALQEMGIGGFTMHARVGLDTEYLGQKFMDCVAGCVAEAKKLSMKAFLYDEDRWPSGAAGGLLTKNDPSLRMRHLLFTPWKYGTPGHGPDGNISTGGAAFRGENGYLIGRYAINLDDVGHMSYRQLETCDVAASDLKPGEKIWYAYVESAPKSSWFNDAWYVDTLSPRAIASFIESTHEKYRSKPGVGSEFGRTVVAIFTDEPQVAGMTQLSTAQEEKDLFAPWTEGIQDTFKSSTGIDLVATLPELIWDLKCSFPDQTPSLSLTRYKFFDHIAELFTSSFLDQLSEWCEEHSLGQMGHMMEEPTLLSQTQCLGEAMRTYRSMQIPGVDMLVDAREYNTVKQCSSVARQYGRSACMSELYGVTNWTYSFKDYKGQGNWQTALGVTLRAHHLSWVSMNGEGKRDYPAQIGYQSPWHKEYGYVETHFARVVTALSRGKARTRVAVIHPIESFWLRYGCSSPEQGMRDQWFSQLTEWLLFGLMDFDFIAESLLPELVDQVAKKLRVGHAEYDVIVLSHLLTLRSSTLLILERFVKAGGKVIIAGGDPEFIDALPSSRCKSLSAIRINFEKDAILSHLEQHRDADIVEKQSGIRAQDLLYQWRDDGADQAFVFITNTERDLSRDTSVTLTGEWSLSCLDTTTGDDYELKTTHQHGQTVFDWEFEGCSSLLLWLKQASSTKNPNILTTFSRTQDRPDWRFIKHIKSPQSVQLDEPNSLLLDFCSYRIDENDKWSELDEILRIDNQVRAELGMRPRGDAMAQPWITPRPRPKPVHVVYLKYHFETSVSLGSAELALEGAEITKIRLDGRLVPVIDVHDYWVDSCITRVTLPEIIPGTHEIVLEVPFDELNTCMERIYILGDFDVTLNQSLPKSKMAKISASPRRNDVGFGDYTKQGLPFYTGNVTYSMTITGSGRLTAIKLPKLGLNPVATVFLNSRKMGTIAMPPYQLSLGTLEPGIDYSLELKVFGNRDHCFGAVHANGEMPNYGPVAWRTTGDQWTDGYWIRNMGILESVELLEA